MWANTAGGPDLRVAAWKHISRGGVQDGSISMWQRKPDLLTYSLVRLSPLLPPASRINNNHTLTLLCQCAATWQRCAAGTGRATLVPETLHTTTSFLKNFDAATDSQRYRHTTETLFLTHRHTLMTRGLLLVFNSVLMHSICRESCCSTFLSS
jgi:hypothetical protein